MKKTSVFLIGLMLLCASATASEAASTTQTVLMVPPEGFQFNAQTAVSNDYQHQIKDTDFLKKANNEFYSMVAKLRNNGVKVIILHQDHALPDAVFPNNWFSTHVDSHGKTTLVLYPMLTANRQKEVNPAGLKKVFKKSNIAIDNMVDLREKNEGVLEGTGSMVLDRKNHIMYASLSPRATKHMINKAAILLHYKPVVFASVNRKNKPIYHTNVMMGLANSYAVICLECIQDPKQRADVINSLKKSGKIIISITQNQVVHLCGNVLELTNSTGASLLVMSRQAYNNFSENQVKEIQNYSKILPMDLNTIEDIGGGSARCMISEIFYQKHKY